MMYAADIVKAIKNTYPNSKDIDKIAERMVDLSVMLTTDEAAVLIEAYIKKKIRI